MRSIKALILLIVILLLIGGLFIYFINKSKVIDLASAKFKGNYKLGELLERENNETKNFKRKLISFKILSQILKYSHNYSSDIKIYLYVKKDGVKSLDEGLYIYKFKNNQLKKLEKDIKYFSLITKYNSPIVIFIGATSGKITKRIYFKSGMICENLLLGIKDLSVSYNLYLPDKLYSLNDINIVSVIYAGYK